MKTSLGLGLVYKTVSWYYFLQCFREFRPAISMRGEREREKEKEKE